MKRLLSVLLLAVLGISSASAQYTPTPENLKSREEFANAGLGIFIHWGIYSMFGQGEWYLNYGPSAQEYAKAARGFYPAYFDAAKWVSDIKASGAKYICVTSRHHDGFSMWGTKQSEYNIVDGTPFGRDVIKELADECQKQGMRLHLYYSHIDWTRPDYPSGRTGLTTGRDPKLRDWDSYYSFMNRQLTELLTDYGPIGAIWFDGKWDHDSDSIPFEWQLEEQYAMIHRLQPGCLIGNNHHESVYPGEDIQIFERDVPGQNEAGLSGQEISRLPLETCQTMNGMWGYKVVDQNYKSVDEIVNLLVRTASMGANLLLNVGPQPSGELPAAAVERLHGLGQWMEKNGATIYGAKASPFGQLDWGTATDFTDKIYLHVLDPEAKSIDFPLDRKIKDAREYASNTKLSPARDKKVGTYHIDLPEREPSPDYIIELTLR